MSIRAYTGSELDLLRSNNQWLKLYLTIFKPATIYTALVNGVPASNDKIASIEYDNGSGTLANVKPGMTIRFGTVAGARDIGEERIRKAPDSDTFFFGETSDIEWANNSHITVVDDFQLRAKHLRVSGSDYFVDYDVAYTDQHVDFDPVPMMGCHRIAWLTGATVSITIPQLADSWVIDSTISSYSTTCAGATVTNSTTSNPTVTFDAPGRYVIYSTVTAANGKSFTGVRYVRVHDTTDTPYSDFELSNFSGNYEDGGFTASIKLFTDTADISTFEEGALVVLHCVDHYDNEQQTIEMEVGTGNILFVGRIASEDITVDKQIATVEFEVNGFQEQGKRTDETVNLSGVSVDVSGGFNTLYSISKGHVSQNFFPYGTALATNTPDRWTRMPSLTVKRALFDLLHWYSTATAIMDVYIEDDERFASELTAASENLWEKINELSYSTIFASPGVDPFGKLWIEIEPQLVPEASRTAVEIMEILPQDWMGKIDVKRTPTQRGSLEIIDRLLLSSQTQSNQLSGLYYGWHHNEFPRIDIEFVQHNRGFTLFPRQKAYIEIAAADNERGIARNINIIPREVSYEHNSKTGTLLPSIQFEAETFEEISIDGDVPNSEGDGSDISIPPLPPLPPLPPYVPVYPGDPTVQANGPSVVLLLEDTTGIVRTTNFGEASGADVKWQFWNAGIDVLDRPYIRSNVNTANTDQRTIFFCTPSGAVYVGVHEKVFRRWFDTIYRAPAIGGTFVKIIDQTWLNANEGADGMVLGMGYNPNKSDEVAFIAGRNAVLGVHFWLGNAGVFVQKTATALETNFPGGLTYGSSKWVWDLNLAGDEYWVRFSADGLDPEHITANFGQGNLCWHVRAGTSQKIFKSYNLTEDLMTSDDNSETVTGIEVASHIGNNLAVSPDGNYLMGAWDTGAGHRGRSSDAGNTWSGIPNLPFGGRYCYAYVGGVGVNSRWIAARGVIRYSPDFGETWPNKEGNINFLIPVGLSISKIVVPGFANGS